MVEKLNYLKYREKGEEFKVPYYISAVVVYNGNLLYYNSNMPYYKGNLPYIMATCLYSQYKALLYFKETIKVLNFIYF